MLKWMPWSRRKAWPISAGDSGKGTGEADGSMDPTQVFRFRSAAVTHAGAVRTINEDACLDRPDAGLWAVADGMGGHDAGAYASRAVVDGIESVIGPEPSSFAVAEIVAALETCNSALRDYAAGKGSSIVGSTSVVLTVCGRRYACVWAGDSRLYQLRGGVLRQLSRDHSYVQELVDGGKLDAAAAEAHPRANVITRAVGAAPGLDLDVVAGEVLDGDVFLLCSDGLSKTVPDDEIAAVLETENPAEAAGILLERAIDRKARDNVTVVIVRCEAIARRKEERSGEAE
jgi:serine/threonine protein phosphatase PrpC